MKHGIPPYFRRGYRSLPSASSDAHGRLVLFQRKANFHSEVKCTGFEDGMGSGYSAVGLHPIVWKKTGMRANTVEDAGGRQGARGSRQKATAPCSRLKRD